MILPTWTRSGGRAWRAVDRRTDEEHVLVRNSKRLLPLSLGVLYERYWSRGSVEAQRTQALFQPEPSPILLQKELYGIPKNLLSKPVWDPILSFAQSFLSSKMIEDRGYHSFTTSALSSRK